MKERTLRLRSSACLLHHPLHWRRSRSCGRCPRAAGRTAGPSSADPGRRAASRCYGAAGACRRGGRRGGAGRSPRCSHRPRPDALATPAAHSAARHSDRPVRPSRSHRSGLHGAPECSDAQTGGCAPGARRPPRFGYCPGSSAALFPNRCCRSWATRRRRRTIVPTAPARSVCGRVAIPTLPGARRHQDPLNR